MALAYFRELDAQTKFAIWRVEEDVSDLMERLQLDDREQKILSKLNKGKRTLHWLATRVLLRQTLNTPDFIDCPSDANGKPYLANFPERISLTHSFDYVAVMLCGDREVGIDLELVKPKILRIADKFMRPEEMRFLPLDTELAIQVLYACWSAKEAVYKLQGNKGISFRDDMTVLPFKYQPQGVLELELHGQNRKERFKVYYERFQEYMLAYVMENHPSEKQIVL